VSFVAPDFDTAEVVTAASDALGRQLTDAVELPGGGDWSLVLRCSDSAGGTVIVKAYPQTTEGRGSFAAEAAGLQLASGSGLTPDFLAADQHLQAVVMSDLGTGGSLADALLGESAGPARSGLLMWATACGRLAVTTSQQRPAFEAAWTGYLGGSPDERHAAGLSGRVLTAAQQAAKMGVVAPAGLAAELAHVAAAVTDDQQAVFSPGDVCPDNNLITSDGIRFVDFEEAGFQSPFLTAAYIRMPFSTCWCVFRLPADLSAAAEDAYRSQVCRALPNLADDAVWAEGMRIAAAAWTLSSTSWLLRRSLAADVPMNADAESPTTRQLMRYRWHELGADLEASGNLPAVAAFLRSLLEATAGWEAPDLPLYPAFRAR
jgi:hypothetical protein